jgi:hypothetical protein
VGDEGLPEAETPDAAPDERSEFEKKNNTEQQP